MPMRRLTDDELDLDEAGKALALCTAAGLCTCLGAASVCMKGMVEVNTKPILAAGLGLAAGVMTYAACLDIWGKSFEAFHDDGMDEADAYTVATLCLFGGMLVMWVLCMIVNMLNPAHDMEDTYAAAVEAKASGDVEAAKKAEQALASQLQRMGLNAALAIALHNMPEGLATFVGYLGEEGVGVALAIGIGFHNIPEGLCVAMPIYYATGSRVKGFLWALLAGLSEPIGALIGWAIIDGTGEDLKGKVYGILFGMVGGMMIMISILELLPAAYRHDPKNRIVTPAAVLGMGMMATSLCLFQY